MTPLTAAELAAARHKLAHRLNELRRRGYAPTRPVTRNDVLDYRITQWQMRKSSNPKESQP